MNQMHIANASIRLTLLGRQRNRFLVKGIMIKHINYTSDCVLTQQFVITYLITYGAKRHTLS